MATGLAGIALIENKSRNEFEASLHIYRSEATEAAQRSAKSVELSLNQIYQNIRTISMLPSVVKIDRHGKGLDDDARMSIQQIYNNLMNSIAVSEVYIVPADLDPAKIDLETGKLEEPILMFDEFITMHSAKENPAQTKNRSLCWTRSG